MKKLNPVLLDLKGLVMNSYHAGMTREPLEGTIKKEINTAEYGFENFLNKFFDPLIEMCGSPIHMIAALDDGRTLRKAMYPEYTSDREVKKQEQDPIEIKEIEKALEYAKNFLTALGVPLVKLKGQEADDVIAYLSEKLKGHKTIATIDKDLIALVKHDVGLFRNGKLQLEYSEKGITVPPTMLPLYLSIIGDTSDGFPGLKGVGPKGWETMVNDFGLDGMEELKSLADADARQQIKSIAHVAGNKVLNKLADNYAEWRLQYQLAKLHPEICEGARVKLEWRKRVPTIERLTKVLTEAGAADLVSRYEQFTYKKTLVTLSNLDKCLREIEELTKDSPACAWDYETFDPVKNPNYIKAANGKIYVDVLNSKIAGCSFALGPNMNHVYYISCRHKDTANVPEQWVLELIKHFEEEGIDLVAQNVSFEATVTKVQLGHEIASWEDTRCYAHQLNENTENGLKALSKHYLNYDQETYAATLAKSDAADMSEISGEDVLSYGCDDSVVTAHLYQFFTILTQLEGTYDFIREHECPAVAPLVDSHIQGIMMDPEEMAKQTAADRQTVAEKAEILKKLLSIHCGNPNFDGVEMLYEDQSSYVLSKTKERFVNSAKANEDEINAATKTALANFRQSLKDNCRYIEPYEIKEFDPFIPTPSKLTKITEHLGMPPIEKVTKSFLSDYLDDHKDPESKFLKLLAPAIHQFKAREGDEYAALAEYCNGIYSDLAPTQVKGTVLNFGSQRQMQHLLYLLLGLPIRIRTKVQKKSLRHRLRLPGSPSTDASAIDFALANDCFGENAWKAEVLKALKAYAAAATRLSIYWTPYPLWMGEDNIMHPSFISPNTATRRPTGSQPNMLQVSKGPVRKCIVPRKPGNVIVSVDFASQELRVMAAVTGDPTFLSAYTGPKDKDLHAMTACGIVPSVLNTYEDVNPAEVAIAADGRVDYDWFKAHQDDKTPIGAMLKTIRGIAKTVNFGAGYGAVGATVSQQAMIPLEIAELAVDGMMQTYPGINKWKAKVYAFAKANGYVATTYGSRRHCGNDLSTGNRQEVGRWERQLSNFLIQGQCADLLKIVLSGAHKSRLFQRYEALLLAPIYDEVLMELPARNLHAFLHELADLMEIKMPGICVPMVADCSFGPNWYAQEEIGARPTQEIIDKALAKIAESQGVKVSAVTNGDYDSEVLHIVEEPDYEDEIAYH